MTDHAHLFPHIHPLVSSRTSCKLHHSLWLQVTRNLPRNRPLLPALPVTWQTTARALLPFPGHAHVDVPRDVLQVAHSGLGQRLLALAITVLVHWSVIGVDRHPVSICSSRSLCFVHHRLNRFHTSNSVCCSTVQQHLTTCQILTTQGLSCFALYVSSEPIHHAAKFNARAI